MTTQSETPRCKSTVYQPQGFGRFYPCSFKAWKDGYCKIHHPDTVKARREKQEKKYEEERAKSPYVLLQKATERNKELEREVTALTAANADLTAQLAEAKADKDEAYRQRNYLVAALARIYPSGVRNTDIPGWSADWHGCCFIDLPSGQISYHFHDSHHFLFDKLPAYKTEWDGHDKDVVHDRLLAIDAAMKEPK